MATDSTSAEYVCTLSEELIQKAEEELNEKAQWRSRDIQALRDMIKKRKDLQIRTDDAYLLRFLRAKKFDYDRAFNLIIRHFQMKKDPKNKKLFSDLRPSAVKHVLDAGVTGVLQHRDKEGRRVMVFRPGKWDPSNFSLDDMFKTNFLTLSKLVEEEETQINGVILMMDLTGIKFKHMRHVKPFYAKRIMGLLQDCFPMRFKGIHYINEPVFFDVIFAIIRQFMKEKLLSRIHFHGSKVQELTEYVDAEYLPINFGGHAPPYTNEDWKNKLLASEAQFEEEAKYGMTDSPSSTNETSVKEEALDCMAGSYRNKDI